MCLYEHNFTRFYLKENKTIRVHVKDKSCNSPEGLQLHQKETPTQVHRCAPVNIPKVLGTAFFIEQVQWLFLNVSVLEKNS